MEERPHPPQELPERARRKVAGAGLLRTKFGTKWSGVGCRSGVHHLPGKGWGGVPGAAGKTLCAQTWAGAEKTSGLGPSCLSEAWSVCRDQGGRSAVTVSAGTRAYTWDRLQETDPA